MKRILVLLLFLAPTGCQRAAADRPGAQLAAKVNCTEISVYQVRTAGSAAGSPAGVAQEPEPGLGRRHGSPAAGTVEQRQPGGALERRDLLADRRLRVAELGGGAVEGTALDDRLECGEVPDFDASQSTMVSNRVVHQVVFY